MTSPVRRRRDASRRRLSSVESSEIVAAARRLIEAQPRGDDGAASAPLTRTDIVLIGRAVRSGWDIPEAKRLAIVQQLRQALDSTDPRLVVSAARCLLAMTGDGG